MNKVDRLEKLTGQLIETYKAKNNDYGDSFADSYKEFGITSAVVRMNDKMNRIKSLSKGEERQVKDESLRDSLMDLANYALMTVIEIENEQMRGPKGEPFKFNRDNIMMDFGGRFETIGRIGEINHDDMVFPECGKLDDFDYEEYGLEDLEDGKKYYLNIALSGLNCDGICLNLNLRDKVCFLSNVVSNEVFQTMFTRKDIVKLIEDYDIDIYDYDIVEVEHED